MSSAWNTGFDTGKSTDVVLVGGQLRRGGWIDGVLHSHDNSGDADPNRTTTLSGEIHHRLVAAGEYQTIRGFGTAIIEAGDIETLFVGKATIDDYYALNPAFNPNSKVVDLAADGPIGIAGDGGGDGAEVQDHLNLRHRIDWRVRRSCLRRHRSCSRHRMHSPGPVPHGLHHQAHGEHGCPAGGV
ncbi:hypothetical protein [Cryobacterium zongtaii]|uniref:hypothetical protein n=1 Tax=Cryobacterium zongtaii TaxID=1259217 RepID=UPI0010574277|nr:hypothetical protein [Cryobacterium zongtaii]